MVFFNNHQTKEMQPEIVLKNRLDLIFNEAKRLERYSREHKIHQAFHALKRQIQTLRA